MTKNNWLKLADDLDLLLQGNLTTDRFLSEYNFNEYFDDIIMSNIAHFISDSDIRSDSESYKLMQETELKKLIHFIRKNAPIEKIRKISMLEYSNTNLEI